MGNKILNISGASTTTEDENFEVYRDISMIAKIEFHGQAGRIDRKEPEYWNQKSVNVKAVFNSLRNIFTWIPGERILLPDFGSKLKYLLYEQITEYNVEQIIAEIKGVCLKYEPRVSIVTIKNASTVDDTENNTVRLNIVFTIPSLGNEQYNYSYICNTTR